MIRSVTQPSRCCQGIQCGIARMSIVAKTGVAQIAAIQQALAGPHRLVVTHVLVDGQRDAGLLAQPHHLDRFGVVHAQRLLRQHAADVIVVLDDLADHFQLHVGRHGHIDNLDAAVGQQRLIIVVGLQAVPLGDLPGVVGRPRRDRHRVEAGLAIGHQVAIGHDEPRPDAADRRVLVTGQPGQIVQIERNAGVAHAFSVAPTSSLRVVSSSSCIRNFCAASVGLAPIALMAESGTLVRGVYRG